MSGLRKYLRWGTPQAHRAVPDDEFGIAHAASAAVTQQIRPRLGRFTQPVGQRDEFLAAVGAYAHEDQDQDAGAGLAEADLGVDAVGPHVDVADSDRSRAWKAVWSSVHCFVSRVTVVGDALRISRGSPPPACSTGLERCSAGFALLWKRVHLAK